MEKNDKLLRDLEDSIYPDFQGFLNKFENSDKIIALVLVGSYSKDTKRKDSDVDLALIVKDGFKEKYIQVLHYFGKDNFIDLMIFEENEILKNTRPRLFGVILRQGKIVFCKDKNTLTALKNIILSKESFESHPYELESIWFRLFWRIKKIESYLGIDEDIAKMVAFQTHIFVGLMFSKLNNIENYSYTLNLKYMRNKHPEFWKEYISAVNDNLKIIGNLKKLISKLPGYEKFKNRKSLVELDNFLSPITVIEENMGTSKIKKYLDNLMID